jgi:F-type H+-transporting ATPase subunit b
VKEQAARIVANAKEEAAAAAVQAKADIAKSVERRMATAVEQLASAETAAIRAVKDQAVLVAVAAARDVIAAQMTAASAGTLIDDAIDAVDAKLH